MVDHLCFAESLKNPVLKPFSKVLSLGWYDGTTSGIAQCSRCSVAFKYDILDWDSDQEHRVFAFSRIDSQELNRVTELLGVAEEPSWPFWVPSWRSNSEDEKQNVRHEVESRLARAGKPEYVVMSDRQLNKLFAVRKLSADAEAQLPSTFDGLPVTNDFAYWKEYVGLTGEICG
jgi:hypothetical protein